jgi:sigma-B regulation protein RsbU (phosphoserine phosphatase)
MDQPLGKILVVDDNEMNRDMLSRRLAKRGHSVDVAEGGNRALGMIAAASYDLVLLDIMMPGIDGYEVLKRIRKDHDPADLPVIMATAKSESEDVVTALKIGANDYVTKPFDFPVVLARVNTQLALKKSRDELARVHRRMKSDLEAAAKIQQTLLPSTFPDIDGVRFAWRYLPCDELAGDTLNVFQLDDTRVGFYVLDVSGHGVPSSLLSVTLSRLLSGRGDPDSIVCRATPVEVLTELARRFPYDDATHQYFTIAYATLDVESRLVTYASAGHPPAIRVRRGAEPELVSSTGPPVSLLPSIIAPTTYEQIEVRLEPRDRLYLYSDGVSEAHSPDGEELGEERVAEMLQGLLDEDLDASITTLLDQVWEWGGGMGPGDDVSILALEIDGS